LQSGIHISIKMGLSTTLRTSLTLATLNWPSTSSSQTSK